MKRQSVHVERFTSVSLFFFLSVSFNKYNGVIIIILSVSLTLFQFRQFPNKVCIKIVHTEYHEKLEGR